MTVARKEHNGERFKVAYLKDQCAMLLGIVEATNAATAEEIAAYTPGGAENPTRGVWGWIRWYATLVRFNARGETGPGSSEHSAEDAAVVEALCAAPIDIVLGDEPRTVVSVFPKGPGAILYLRAKDRLVAWLAVHLAALRKQQDPTALDLEEQIATELDYQQRLICWCVTHRGPSLPFDQYADRRPPLPAELPALAPLDYFRIHRAYVRCNVGRIEAADALVSPPKPDGSETRPSWAAIFSTIADEQGIQPAVLMRDYSLGEILVGMKVVGGVRAEAMERAKSTGERGED